MTDLAAISSPPGSKPPSPVWQVLGASVRGAAHLRSGAPNQDAIGWLPEPCTGTAVLLAVADGHGSARSFRSERGARLAVAAVQSECAALLEPLHGPGHLSALKRMALTQLPQRLVHQWQTAVQADLDATPFTAEELAVLGITDDGGPSAPGPTLLAYGSTLLATLVTPHFHLHLQLGDGDILTVASDGTVSRPFERDARLLGNATTSLCSPDAVRELRLVFQPLVDSADDIPQLILLSTDGYANSFRDEPAFLQVGTDLLDLLVAEGAGAVAAQLPGWLDEASAHGSGDDVTLGLLYRSAPPPATAQALQP